MDLEETLSKKEENLRKLIRNKEEAIRKELYQYEEAAFYIRLQSACYNLYPVVVKALALLISNDRQRSIFCSIVKGHRLERLAAFHNLTPEETVQEFRSIVRELHSKIKKGAFTAKESVNIRLLMERDYLKSKLQNQDQLCAKLQLANDNLQDQLEILLSNENKKIESWQAAMQKKEMEIREEIRKELQEELKTEAEEQAMNTPNHIPFVGRWIQWFRMIYYRYL